MKTAQLVRTFEREHGDEHLLILEPPMVVDKVNGKVFTHAHHVICFSHDGQTDIYPSDPAGQQYGSRTPIKSGQGDVVSVLKKNGYKVRIG